MAFTPRGRPQGPVPGRTAQPSIQCHSAGPLPRRIDGRPGGRTCAPAAGLAGTRSPATRWSRLLPLEPSQARCHPQGCAAIRRMSPGTASPMMVTLDGSSRTEAVDAVPSLPRMLSGNAAFALCACVPHAKSEVCPAPNSKSELSSRLYRPAPLCLRGGRGISGSRICRPGSPTKPVSWVQSSSSAVRLICRSKMRGPQMFNC